jgi:hypothetical protein
LSLSEFTAQHQKKDQSHSAPQVTKRDQHAVICQQIPGSEARFLLQKHNISSYHQTANLLVAN